MFDKKNIYAIEITIDNYIPSLNRLNELGFVWASGHKIKELYYSDTFSSIINVGRFLEMIFIGNHWIVSFKDKENLKLQYRRDYYIERFGVKKRKIN